jgi:hypothetical protein
VIALKEKIRNAKTIDFFSEMSRFTKKRIEIEAKIYTIILSLIERFIE